jgi:hypothetical protein
MRDVFSKTISDDRVSVAEGTFQQTNIEDGWADLLVVAQVLGPVLIVSFANVTYTGLSLVPGFCQCLGRVCAHSETGWCLGVDLEFGGEVGASARLHRV